MKFCFADDAQQKKPSREGMRPLVAVGGVVLDGAEVGAAQRALDEICTDAGFPDGEEFKWSPGRELWMRDQLEGSAREDFYLAVLGALRERRAAVVVVVVDREAGSATGSDDPEEDATRLFLERASNQFAGDEGIVVVDRPSGGRRDENQFIADCVAHLQDDSTYSIPDRFALPVISAQSRHLRLLQAADLVTSCTINRVAGENQFTPPVFEVIKPMFASNGLRQGGVGLKIHPDYRYANLYHWLLGEDTWWKGNVGVPLPRQGTPTLYAANDGS